MKLESLFNRALVWRGGDTPPCAQGAVPTGHAALDALLPGGGWPLGALTEILTDRHGSGALQLALPALVGLSRSNRWLAWVAPPHVPYAPALAATGMDLSRVLLVYPSKETGDRFKSVAHANTWATEQALRSGTCAAVLAWLPEGGRGALRRLQLAAEAGRCWALLLRPLDAAERPSPAALRLAVEAEDDGLRVRIIKGRGGRPAEPLHLEADHAVAVPAPAGPVAGGLHPRAG